VTMPDMAPERSALLLIDMQVDFGASDGEMARQGKDMTAPQAAVANAELLAMAARAAGVRVVFVRLQTQQGALKSQGLCVEATPGADFIGPKPQLDELIVSKSRFSAFSGTGLAEELRFRQIQTLVLAGLTTECCIQASGWAALELDFDVVLASDACAAYEEDLHRHALKALESSGARVITSADLATLWKNTK
jgi:nicotinamidase-related amidase